MLKTFLDSFNFKYNFKSSTSLYKSGFFNSSLQTILENYDGIMNIILPTLRKRDGKKLIAHFYLYVPTQDMF